MKASQNECCCQAGLCFPSSPEADLNVCVCFVFFSFFFSTQEHYRLAEFMLGILRCLHFFALPKASCAKKIKMPAWNALCTFFSVVSLCYAACARELVNKREKKRERGVTTGQDDSNHYTDFYKSESKPVLLKMTPPANPERNKQPQYHLGAVLTGFSNLSQDVQ